MDGGIAINFAGRGLENPRPHALGQPQHIYRAMHRRLGRLHGIMLIMDGRGRTSQIIDLINFDIEWKSHIVADQLETWIAEKMGDIFPTSGEVIIGADDVIPLLQQPFTKVRAKKASAAGHKNALGCKVMHKTLRR